MKRDSRIRKLGKGEFRSRLSIEDVRLEDAELFYITNKYNREEKIALFMKTPVPSPLMQYVFYLKIKTLEDKYLKRMIHELAYINPGIDELGLKQMTVFIIRALVYYDKKKEEYALSYEQVHPIVEKEYVVAEDQGVIVNADKVVLFEKHTALDGKEKQKISTESRYFRDSYLNSEIIHNKAMQVVSRRELYAVNKVAVHKEVKHKKGLKTIKTFNKHIAEKTIQILKDSLEERRFRTEREAKQFEVYKVCREKKMTTAQMVKKMGVSFSTLAFFSRVFKEFKHREILE